MNYNAVWNSPLLTLQNAPLSLYSRRGVRRLETYGNVIIQTRD